MKKKIAIFTKAESAPEYVVKSFKDGGYDVVEVKNGRDIPDDISCLVVFGGDGTVLEAVKNVREDVVVCGINTGNLGFLTQFEKDSDLNDVVKAVANGEFVERMTLDFACDEHKGKALNEIVLKSADSRPVFIDVYVDGKFVDSYHSDGAIVSSPTGSTAYALSAGGPIVAPDVDAVVIMPICAHSLHSRPLVVSANSKVELRLKNAPSANICADGDVVCYISGNVSIYIEKSAQNVRFLAVENDNFFKKLIQKMNRWGLVDPRG